MDESCRCKPHAHKHAYFSRLVFYGLGILSLGWLLLRSGTKPTRMAYPCQRTAAAFGLNFLASFSPWLGSSLLPRTIPDFRAESEVIRSRHSVLLGLLRCALVLSPIIFLSSGEPYVSGIAPTTQSVQPAVGEKTVSLPEQPSPHPTVAIIHREHTPGEAEIASMVTEALEASLGYGGLANVVKSGDTVLIKPNLGGCGTESHETTDWRVVKPIVQAVKQAGASQVYIGEGPGCSYGLDVFDRAGYTANIEDVIYINFNDVGSELDQNYYNVNVIGGLWDEPIAIPQIYFDADVVISVPKLKTHNEAGVTISVKNAMGVPPVPLYTRGTNYRNKIHEDYEVRKTIVQINLARQPDLAVVDALLAGQGEGPWSAEPIEMNTILASRDMVALDAVGATIMGIDPRRIPYLVYAHEKNLGIIDIDSIRTVGSTLEAVKKDFRLPDRAAVIYRKATVIQRTASIVAIDGSEADWGLVEPIKLDQEADILAGSEDWDGPGDMSIESRFLYDQEAIYAIFRIRDERKVLDPLPEQAPSQGDRLELDLSVADPWYRLDNPAYGDDDFRLSLGYGTNPAVWDLGRGFVMESAHVNLVEGEDGYLVELSIPFSALNNFSPAENKQIGLDLSIVDVDGGAEETRMAWSGGAELPDDARLMGVGLLGPVRGCTNPQAACIYLPIQLNH